MYFYPLINISPENDYLIMWFGNFVDEKYKLGYRLHERTFLITYNITLERHLNQKDDHALVLQCGSDVDTYCLILLSDPSLEGMSSVFALLSR